MKKGIAMIKKALSGVIILLSILFLIVLLSLEAQADSKDLTFEWTKDVIEKDLAGFTLYEYDGSGVATGNTFDIPYTGQTDFSHAEIITVPAGVVTRMCYAIDAYDTSGNQSNKSNQACKDIDFEAPGECTEFKIILKVISE